MCKKKIILLLFFLAGAPLFSNESHQDLLLFQSGIGKDRGIEFNDFMERLKRLGLNSSDFLTKVDIGLKKHEKLHKKTLNRKSLNWNIATTEPLKIGEKPEEKYILVSSDILAPENTILFDGGAEASVPLNEYNQFVFEYVALNKDAEEKFDVGFQFQAERHEWELGELKTTSVFAYTENALLEEMMVMRPTEIIFERDDRNKGNFWGVFQVGSEAEVSSQSSVKVKEILAIDFSVSSDVDLNRVKLVFQNESKWWKPKKEIICTPRLFSASKNENVVRLLKTQWMESMGKDLDGFVIKQIGLSIHNDDYHTRTNLLNRVTFRAAPVHGVSVLLPQRTTSLRGGKNWTSVDLSSLMIPNSKLLFTRGKGFLRPWGGAPRPIVQVSNMSFDQTKYVPMTVFESNGRGWVQSLLGPFIRPEEFTSKDMLEWANVEAYLPFSSYSFSNFRKITPIENNLDVVRYGPFSMSIPWPLLENQKGDDPIFFDQKKDNLSDVNLVLNTDGYFEEVTPQAGAVFVSGKGQKLQIQWFQNFSIKPQSHFILKIREGADNIAKSWLEINGSNEKIPFSPNEAIQFEGKLKEVTDVKIYFEFLNPFFGLSFEKAIVFRPEMTTLEAAFKKKLPEERKFSLKISPTFMPKGVYSNVADSTLFVTFDSNSKNQKMNWDTPLTRPVLQGKNLYVNCRIISGEETMASAILKILFFYEKGSFSKTIPLVKSENNFIFPFSELIPKSRNIGSMGGLRSLAWEIQVGASGSVSSDIQKFVISAELEAVELRSAHDDFIAWGGGLIPEDFDLKKLMKNNLTVNLPDALSRVSFSSNIFPGSPFFSLESLIVQPKKPMPNAVWADLTSREIKKNPAGHRRLIFPFVVSVLALALYLGWKKFGMLFGSVLVFLKEWILHKLNLEWAIHFSVFLFSLFPISFVAVRFWKSQHPLAISFLILCLTLMIASLIQLRRIEVNKSMNSSLLFFPRWVIYGLTGFILLTGYFLEAVFRKSIRDYSLYVVAGMILISYLNYHRLSFFKKTIPNVWRIPLVFNFLSIAIGCLSLLTHNSLYRDCILTTVGIFLAIATYYSFQAIAPRVKKYVPLIYENVFLDSSRTFLFLGFACFPISAILLALSFEDAAALPSDMAFYFILIGILKRPKSSLVLDDKNA